MEKKVYELIDSYREEYIRMLRNWIRTPSVKGEAENASDWLSRLPVPETVSPVQIIMGTSPSKKRRMTWV